MQRIHLVSNGGGAACGAHSLGKPHGEREVLSTEILALIDCLKCKQTDRYKELLNPAQYRLRLFTMVEGKRVINPAFAELKRKGVA